MFARSIVVDFAVVSKFAEYKSDTRRLVQSREIVNSWFWGVLEVSYEGIDRVLITRDREQENRKEEQWNRSVVIKPIWYGTDKLNPKVHSV